MGQYRKGYLFEKKTNSLVQEILSQYKELKFYSVESRGSKGTADIIFGLYNKKNKKRIWFGIQCKKGFISKPEVMRCTTAARQENGMFLFFATLDKTKKELVYTPDILEWIDLWMTNNIS